MRIIAAPCLPDHAKATDFSFVIEARLVPPFDADPFMTEPVPARRKAYELDETLFRPQHGAEKALFIAEIDDRVAGYVALGRGWTGCAEIEDIATARHFRRRGVATALLDQARAWAGAVGLPALRLETQSNNVAACRLYRDYGFELGGFDRFLYRELGADVAVDVALFWYLGSAAAD